MLSSANFKFEGVQSALIASNDGTLIEGWEYRDGVVRVVAESIRQLIVEMEEEGVWETTARGERAERHLHLHRYYVNYCDINKLWKLEGTLLGISLPADDDQTEGGDIFDNGDDS